MTDHGKPFRMRLLGQHAPIDKIALAMALAKAFAVLCFIGFALVWYDARAQEVSLLEEAANNEYALVRCLNYQPVHMVPYVKKTRVVTQQTGET